LYIYHKWKKEYLVEEKTNDDIRIKVENVWYCIPGYCLIDLLSGEPKEFYGCHHIYTWAQDPLYYTSFKMVKEAIKKNKKKFISFILYGDWK